MSPRKADKPDFETIHVPRRDPEKVETIYIPSAIAERYRERMGMEDEETTTTRPVRRRTTKKRTRTAAKRTSRNPETET
jgi:hypothetical protein